MAQWIVLVTTLKLDRALTALESKMVEEWLLQPTITEETPTTDSTHYIKVTVPAVNEYFLVIKAGYEVRHTFISDIVMYLYGVEHPWELSELVD